MGRRQLRLALSMNGGVSLAVWIAGAVAEIDELRRGTSEFWTDVLRSARYTDCQVDVLVGASAGGLNGVLLAQAIRSDLPFSETLGLWHDRADIHELVKPPNRATDEDPYAVLRGQYFLDQVGDVLERLAPTSATKELTQDLAVFASATLVVPVPTEYADVPGPAIRDARSDAYFHVARRGTVAEGLDGFAEGPPPLDSTVAALAKIGRATSSLPGLFQPVVFEPDRMGPRLVGAFDRSDTHRLVMDGGVIDNVPIARAIRAIYQSPADSGVRRALLYLHPDPGGQGTTARPASVWQVVGSFFGKRSESIREDIELLRSHNSSVARRREEIVATLERLLGPNSPAPESPTESALGRAATVALLMRAAADPAAEMHWHAPRRRRVAAIVDVRGGIIADQLRRDIDRAMSSDQPLLVAEATRRQVAALTMAIHVARRRDDSMADGDPVDDFSAVLRGLDHIRLICDLITSRQLAAFLDGDPRQAVARLIQSANELDGIGDIPLTTAVVAWLAGWDQAPLPDASGAATPTLADERRLIAERLRRMEPVPDLPLTAVVCGPSAASIPALTSALLALIAEPVASDQEIAFVRAAGDVESPAATAFDDEAGSDRGQRIAGRQLHHLGAFFERSWRVNDTRWGQLDVVTALVDAVLDDTAYQALGLSDPAARAEHRRELIRCRQIELLTRFRAEDEAEGRGAPPASSSSSASSPSTDRGDDVLTSEWFRAWARDDRRISSLLGSRLLTSTGLRATLSATRVAQVRASMYGDPAVEPLHWSARHGIKAIRPLLMAVVGALLAGRWAVAAIVWTGVVSGAPRAEGGRWALAAWVGTAVLTTGMVWLVEWRLKPLRVWYRSWLPYGTAAAGAVVGAVAVAARTGPGEPWPQRHPWFLVTLGAAVAAAALFHWMRWWAAALVVALIAGIYGTFAAAGWSLWWAWAIVFFGVPMLLCWRRIPDRLLRP